MGVRCECSCRKVFLWVTFAIHGLVCLVYIAVSLATFNNVKKLKLKSDEHAKQEQMEKEGVHLLSVAAFASAIQAATMLGFLLVLAWMVFAILTLVVISFKKSSKSDLLYGMVLGTALYLAAYMILCGAILVAGKPLAEAAESDGQWGEGEHTTYNASLAFSFVLLVAFLLIFLLLTTGRIWLAFLPESLPQSSNAAFKSSNYSPNTPGGQVGMVWNNQFDQGRGSQV